MDCKITNEIARLVETAERENAIHNTLERVEAREGWNENPACRVVHHALSAAWQATTCRVGEHLETILKLIEEAN